MTQQIARRTTVVTATITNGTALSPAIALQDHVIVGILLPAAWTAAGLTFQGAIGAGATFGDLYDDAGTEVALAAGTIVGGRFLVNASLLEKLAALGAFKIRSGTSGVPVNQGADRTFTLIFKA